MGLAKKLKDAGPGDTAEGYGSKVSHYESPYSEGAGAFDYRTPKGFGGSIPYGNGGRTKRQATARLVQQVRNVQTPQMRIDAQFNDRRQLQKTRYAQLSVPEDK